MRPHPRIRKTVKWGGAVVCVLLAGLWVWSTLHPYSKTLMPGYLVELTNAGVQIGAADPATPLNPRPGGYSSVLDVQDWSRSSHLVWDVRVTYNGRGLVAFFPLWIPLLLVAAPTLLAWRLDTLARQRAMAHLCQQCRYDRTGLALGAVCPECGAAAPVVVGLATKGI